MYIDTHAHLYDQQYQHDIAQVIQQAQQAKVNKLYLPNLSLDTIAPMLSLAQTYPRICRPMLGIHPCEIKKDYQNILAQVEPWFLQQHFVAIGEVGMDLYWDKTHHQQQAAALHIFIDWALQYNLPLVLHARNSFSPIFAILKQRKNTQLRGIFHCFTGTQAQAQQAIDLGFLLGIGGIITFAKSHLPHLIADINLEHLVLETDSPYLAPTPHRGKRNTPAHIPLIAQKIAEIKQIPIEKVANVTTHNALRLFEP